MIRLAQSPEDIDAVRVLFREYAQTPGVEECTAGFADEVAKLPGRYVALFLAEDGCAALLPFDHETVILKRLYVREATRGTGLGRRLVQAAMVEAKNRGYARMRLDTLPTMTAAHRLYETLGFHDIPPFGAKPVPGARFMELAL